MINDITIIINVESECQSLSNSNRWTKKVIKIINRRITVLLIMIVSVVLLCIFCRNLLFAILQFYYNVFKKFFINLESLIYIKTS